MKLNWPTRAASRCSSARIACIASSVTLANSPVRALPAPLVQVTPPNHWLAMFVAFEDAVHRHKLEVVLVCADAEVSRPRQCIGLPVLGRTGQSRFERTVGRLS